MRKGRRPAVTRYERRLFLEKLEQGKGITQIAKEARRDIRVVKRNIELAEQERELGLARRDFVRGRLEQHQGDLLAEVSRLSDVVRRGVYFGVQPDDPVQRKIHEALKQHLGRVPLGQDLESYRKVATSYTEKLKELERVLDEAEARLVVDLPSGVTTDSWSRTVMGAVGRNVASGVLPEGKYGTFRGVGGCNIEWDNQIIARSPVVDVPDSQVIEAHKQLCSIAASSMAELQNLDQQIKELGVTLADGLDILVVRRFVAGRCDYCPA